MLCISHMPNISNVPNGFVGAAAHVGLRVPGYAAPLSGGGGVEAA